MGKREITILHCSDLHYGFEQWEHASAKDIQERSEKIEGFLQLIDSFPEGWAPTILVISGDIGWTGNKSDYESFQKKFLDIVLNKTGISINNTIFCIGNHDKDDKKSASLNRPDGINSTCSDLDPANIEDWLEKAFYSFLDSCRELQVATLSNSIHCQEEHNQERAKYVCGHVKIGFVNFLVLNSAWDCYHNRKRGTSDKGLIRIGSNFVYDAFNRLSNDSDKSIVVTILHHPFDWIHNDEAKTIDYIKSHSHVVLCGHVHEFCQYDEKGCMILCCSTISSNDTTDFGVELVKIVIDDTGLPPKVDTKFAVKSVANRFGWVWQDGGPPSVLGSRTEIARQEDEYKAKNEYIYTLLREYSTHKVTFDRICKTGSVDFSIYEAQLESLNIALQDLKTEIEGIGVDAVMSGVYMDVENMLRLILELLRGLGRDSLHDNKNGPKLTLGLK